MTNIQSFKYACFVWLTAVVVGSFILSIALHTVYATFLALAFSGVFSIPSFFIFWLIANYLGKRSTGIINIKGALSIIAIVLTILPMYFFGFASINLEIVLPYIFSTLLGVWIHKLKGISEEDNNNISNNILDSDI
jgi:hypothetical protein